MSKERLEEITDAIAYLRDEYVDAEVVSEYYGHDIMGEIVGCPISALSYTGDYIELLQKRVQELEKQILYRDSAIESASRLTEELVDENKRYCEALKTIIQEPRIEMSYQDMYEDCVDVAVLLEIMMKQKHIRKSRID